VGGGVGWRHGLAALGLTLLALALRLPRLLETPGWDPDEGYNLEIAWQLLHGRAQAFAVSQSFVQHPVLFYALLAPLLALAGKELLVARALVAVVGALAVGVLYLAVRSSAGTRAAVLAAVTLAGAHFVVLHGRLAYTYNLLLLWAALSLWFVTRWEQTRALRWLLGTVIAAALGLLSDQVGLALPIFVAARVLPRRRLALGVLGASVAPAVLAALAMAIVEPGASAQDWAKSLRRVVVETPGLSGGPATRLALWFVNYLHLLRAEWWLPLAVAGLFCVRDLTGRRRVLTLAGLTALPAFALRDLEPFFRTGIPLFVPAAVGIGALLDAGLGLVFRSVPGRPARVGAAALVIALPLGLELARSAGAAATSFQTRFDWALVTDQRSARETATYVNFQVRTGDVILVSPHVAWLYDARAVDFFQAVAWTGESIAFYPAGLSRARFKFEPSVERARFAAIDPFWRQWVEVSVALAQLTARIEQWPEVYRAGEISVRRNPAA